MKAAAEISTMLKRLSLLAALALIACAPGPLTDRDFIVEVHDKDQWAVSEAQAAEAKLALLDYLDKSHPARGEAEEYFEKERPGVNAKISTFYLQYYGNYLDLAKRVWTDATGDKAILISGLCAMLPGVTVETMHKELVGVSDGGSCVISAGYSLSQRKIIYFTVGFKV